MGNGFEVETARAGKGQRGHGLRMLLYFRCDLVQFFSVCLWHILETVQLLSFVSGNNMDVQVKYLLSSGFSVLLDYADAISFCGFFDGECDALGNSVKMGN
jgi:hypothetical protein